MTFYVPSLFISCFNALCQAESNEIFALVSSLPFPVSIYNEIVKRKSNRENLTLWRDCDDTKVNGVLELTLYFDENFYSRYSNISNVIDLSCTKNLSLDFTDVSNMEIYCYSHLIYPFFSSFKNLNTLIVKLSHMYNDPQSNMEKMISISDILSNNPYLASVIFEEHKIPFGIIVSTNYENPLPLKDAILFLLKFVPEKIEKIGLIKHDASSSLEIYKTISTRFLNLKVLQLHGLLNSNTCLDYDLNCLFNLKNLVSLDLSIDKNVDDPFELDYLSQLVETISNFLNRLIEKEELKLKVLDISGIKQISANLLVKFVNTHKSLNSFRLCGTDYNLTTYNLLNVPHYCEIVDYYSTSGVSRCLSIHFDCQFMVEKTLIAFFDLNSYDIGPYELIFEQLINIMNHYIDHVTISLAATACLYLVIKRFERFHIPLRGVRRCVNTLLKIADRYSHKDQIVKNVMVIICKDLIITKSEFDQLECMKVCFKIIRQVRDQPTSISSINLHMAISICSVLASKMPVAFSRKIANLSNINTLLYIVNLHTTTPNNNSLLQHTLVCLWNLTDECPIASTRFVQLFGLHTCLELYNTSGNDPNNIQKILGLLNNVAEVSRLRHFFFHGQIIKMIHDCAAKTDIHLAFFACGILANLLVNWVNIPNVLEDYHPELIEIVIITTLNSIGMTYSRQIVAYRSFTPFIELLNSDIPATIFWALWSIRHVTKLQPEYYVQVIKSDDILLRAIQTNLDHSMKCISYCASDLIQNLAIVL